MLLVDGLALFAGAETGLASWRFQHANVFAPAPPSDQITILGIDDGALATWGEWGEWPRERFAGVIDLLTELGAQTIVLDIRFETARDEAGDRALAAAMRGHGNVAIAVGAAPPVEPIRSAAVAWGGVAFDDASASVMLEVPGRSGFTPTPQLGLVGAALHQGDDAKVLADAHGERLLVPWNIKPFRRSSRNLWPAWRRQQMMLTVDVPLRLVEERRVLSRAVAFLLEREVDWPIAPDVIREAHDEAGFLREELGGEQAHEQTPRAIAAARAVQDFDSLAPLWAARGQSTDEYGMLESFVRDRLVFIGWTATGAIADFVPTPLGVRTPGVVVHAQIAAGEMTGFGKKRWPGRASGLMLTALLGALGAAIGTASPKRATLLGMLALIGYVVVNAYVLFDGFGLLVPVAAPLASCALALIASASVRAAGVHQERAAIRRQFRARIDPKLADRLERDPGAIKLDGELRDVTIVFTDLSGYSALVEQLEPREVVALLNTLQTVVASALIEHGGYINKFMGDGIMAIWGAPESINDHPSAACAAVMRAHTAVSEAVNAAVQKAGHKLALRAGISSGQAIVGDCGAPPTLNDYTAIGDVVNIASRLSDIGTILGTPILITQMTADALHLNMHEPWAVRCLGPIQLQGRTQPVRVCELFQAGGCELNDALTQAVAHFEAGEYEASAKLWREASRCDESLSRLAKHFIARCEVLSRDSSHIRALVIGQR